MLQVVYVLPENTKIPLYVGQQMDAYIEAVEPEGVSLDTDLRRLNPFEKKAEDQSKSKSEDKPKIESKTAA